MLRKEKGAESKITESIKIGLIGDFDANRLSHKATNEALKHCARFLGIGLELNWLATESLVSEDTQTLGDYNGLWCVPGSPYKSMIGALNAIRFARENDIPFIGTCGGFQHAVIEYARNVIGINNAQHEENNPDAPELVVSALSCSLIGEKRKVIINRNSLVYKYYGQTELEERFNCNFGLNPQYKKLFVENGFRISGTDENGEARILELSSNRFHIATLFQPQLSASAANPHRLIIAYLNCIREIG
jgi:CTP synthase (UTP-ammonia lyase)